MGQIKNIKLHIVTDIKHTPRNTQLTSEMVALKEKKVKKIKTKPIEEVVEKKEEPKKKKKTKPEPVKKPPPPKESSSEEESIDEEETKPAAPVVAPVVAKPA